MLVVAAPSERSRAASVVYATTSTLLFGVSAIYHRGHWKQRARNLLKRLDHANIYLMIAGSYTPIAVLALKGDVRTVVLAAIWSAASVGVAFRLIWVGAPRWLYTPLYILLGWVAVLLAPQILRGAGETAFILIVTGGLLYTLGGLVYGLRWPDPWPKWFGFHEIFHSFTIAAYATQYAAVSLLVLGATRPLLAG